MQIYCLRKHAFIDRKGWSIQSYKGGDIEYDEYDDSQAYYIFTLHEDFVTGCVRLRPSTSPTLMSGSFAWLKKQVKSNDFNFKITWEASRFFITPAKCLIGRRDRIDTRTRALFISMIEFGVNLEFEGYEVVVDEVMLRILRRSRWPVNILSSGIGNMGEKIYYGILPCDLKILNDVASF